ncbi:hypothetical protein P7K49_025124 [Saguinus oedipus]|uniref:Uncharacterized protein n=1 Tax=Saguinus oedipus TaxID=9490 RepID=A0ABQ9UH71_SAGOE|nr:hypothetical protein P7K49_025124 [Saguinus oedipus]
MVLFCLKISSLAFFLSPQQAALLSGSSEHQSVAESVSLTVHEKLPCRGDDKTTVPGKEVALATSGAPPLEIFWSMGDENSYENVASSRFPSYNWELQSQAISDQPSSISLSREVYS